MLSATHWDPSTITDTTFNEVEESKRRRHHNARSRPPYTEEGTHKEGDSRPESDVSLGRTYKEKSDAGLSRQLA